MDWAGWALFGLIATGVLTVIMVSAQLASLTRLDIPLLLGTLVTPDPDRARLIGSLIHVVIGQCFALGYAAAFALLHTATWCLGALLGLLHAAVALTVLVPLLAGIHPNIASPRSGPKTVAVLEPPGLLALNYGPQNPHCSVGSGLRVGCPPIQGRGNGRRAAFAARRTRTPLRRAASPPSPRGGRCDATPVRDRDRPGAAGPRQGALHQAQVARAARPGGSLAARRARRRAQPDRHAQRARDPEARARPRLRRRYRRQATACWGPDTSVSGSDAYGPSAARPRVIPRAGQVATIVAAPIDAVWAVVADVTRVGEWSGECRRVAWLDGATSAVPGARFRGTNKAGPWTWSRVNEVIAVDALHELAWRTVPTFRFPDSTEWRIGLEAVDGGTRIVQSYEVIRAPAVLARVYAILVPSHRGRGTEPTEDLRRLGEVAGSEPAAQARRADASSATPGSSTPSAVA